ncbi:hypothetical protein H9P43_010018 [Blastocladiella emersonii ATCC 22665]|nr:hypothetical protein H9P43_010018 [Blastocladiella emersonii ATCC 22665]
MSDNVAHAVAGAAGGIVSTVATYPLITISSRQAAAKKGGDKADEYKSFLDGCRKIVKSEGVAGLYSGINSAIFGIAVTNFVYYGAYETTKSGFLKTSGRRVMSTIESMVAGAIAGSATVLVTNPIWVVNTRMTVKKDASDDTASSSSGALKKKQAATAWDTFLAIIRDEGPTALWKGLLPALILVSNPVLQFSVFEQTRGRLEKYRRNANGGKPVALSSFEIFVLGAIAKLAATGITYPYVLIKTRLQNSRTSQSKTILDEFREILRTEGVKGLYKGIETKIVQSVLTASLLFTAKEELFKVAIFILTLIGAREKRIAKA